MNTSRFGMGRAGTQTSALGFGGSGPSPAAATATESYNGSTWTSSPNSMNTARRNLRGVGTQTAALGFGGNGPGGAQVGETETWNGTSWTEINLPLTIDGHKTAPNDIEITAGGKIWLSSTNNSLFGDGGGRVFSSTDGVNFQEKFAITSGDRTQIAVSKTNPEKVYVLAEIPNSVAIVKTLNSFNSVTNLTLPIDADSGIPATDFTRGQAFYDLLIAADPVNDEIIYLGGIDLFKSTTGGASYIQLSHWYGGFGFQEVHADQHIAIFEPGNSSVIYFGNDGGIYRSTNATSTLASHAAV
jgi:hypothetical protein